MPLDAGPFRQEALHYGPAIGQFREWKVLLGQARLDIWPSGQEPLLSCCDAPHSASLPHRAIGPGAS